MSEENYGLPKHIPIKRFTAPELRDLIPLGVYHEEVPKLRAHCEAIEYLTVYEVCVHEDHKRFVVYCSGRRGAERAAGAGRRARADRAGQS